MSVCRTRKDIIARILCTTAAAWLLCAHPVSAHNVWLEPDAQGGYVMQFGGHEGRTEVFDPAKLQRVHAYDLRGREVAGDAGASGVATFPPSRSRFPSPAANPTFFVMPPSPPYECACAQVR